MPRASVVIPCHNSERFIEETLASALSQTVTDIEVVCVENNCTDDTLAILERIAAADPRARVMSESTPGEGPARDAGLQAATGDWLYFLDHDDLMEPTLLEEAIGAGEHEDADLVVFPVAQLNFKTGEVTQLPRSCRHDWLPEGASSFCPREYPRHVFDSFLNWMNNKLFRGSFVRERGIHVQHLSRAADMLMSCRALSEARRVAVVDKPLERYRWNNPGSAFGMSGSHPLDLLSACLELRASLERTGTWDVFHDAYCEWVIESWALALEATASLDALLLRIQTLRDGAFEQMGVVGFPREEMTEPAFWDTCHLVLHGTEAEVIHQLLQRHRLYLSNERDEASWRRLDLARERERVQTLERELSERDAALRAVTGSVSFRAGRAMTALPRAVRDALASVMQGRRRS